MSPLLTMLHCKLIQSIFFILKCLFLEFNSPTLQQTVPKSAYQI